MQNINNPKAKSQLLNEYWDLIAQTYISAKEKYKVCYSQNNLNEDEWKYQNLFDFLTEEWKRIYPNFVLVPIEKRVLDLFYAIQTKEFEKQKNISQEINKYTVYYYLSQYFYLFVTPTLRDQYNFEDQPRFEIKTDDENILLLEIFEEIWNELNDKDDDEFGDFDELDLEGFYEFEFNALGAFLSKCWNKTKEETNTKVIATLVESTGAGENYFLDENRNISDLELIEIINSK
jgi:hypothetical protein